MLGISKGTHEILLDILHNRDLITNVYIFQTKGVDKAVKAARSRHIKDLENREILRRIIGEKKKRLLPTRLDIRTGGVMLNPYMIKPPNTCQQMQAIWNVL